MAGFEEGDKQYFPLKNIDSVVDLFKFHLNSSNEPDLALLSIVLGCIENVLTSNRSLTREEKETADKTTNLPLVKLSTVHALYQRFVTFVKGSVDLTEHTDKYATREFVKKVSDVIWSGLSRGNYQDKAHLQSLYSYLTGNKLDCFGVALGVVAACQILGFHDVHLSLSEDHAWVVFGEGGKETAEVTWHGKGVEDKRGQPITLGVAEKSWLYLDNNAVICDRFMEVAAIVSSINPAINATMDSVEVAQLQQDLLWLLYDMGHLNKYPMALGTLGDLEELDPSHGHPTVEAIHNSAISIAKTYYQNKHVYPYTYLGSYYHRKGLYKDALRAWANAAEAISHYNYNREDEEIYKEFLEIAHDLIPHIVKLASDGYLLGSTHHKTVKTTVTVDSVGSTDFLKDAENYELILRFYDGICKWEEDSSTPVLHITWAKHFNFCISKFVGRIREAMEVEKCSGDEDSSSSSSSEDDEEVARDAVPMHKKKHNHHHYHPHHIVTRGPRGPLHDSTSVNGNQCMDKTGFITNKLDSTKTVQKRGRGRPRSTSISSNNSNNRRSNSESFIPSPQSEIPQSPMSPILADCNDNNNELPKLKNDIGGLVEEEKIKNTIAELASKVDIESSEESQNESTNTKIADLAKACGESILNPDFLLGKGEPFTTGTATSMFVNTTVDSKADFSNDDLSLTLNKSALLSTDCSSNHTSVFSFNGCHLMGDVEGENDSALFKPHTQSRPPIVHDKHSQPVKNIDKESQPLLSPYNIGEFLSANTNNTYCVNFSVNGMHDKNQRNLISQNKQQSIPNCQQQKLKFHSAKMKGLKHLLLSEKLNSSAINLQLTAQSQVIFKRSKSIGNVGSNRNEYGSQRKRTRRD